jgi:hypothetical protein
MAKRGADRSWGELRLGIIVAVVVLLVGMSIFLIGSTVGPLKVTTYRYLMEVDDAAGIRVGSIVRVGGITAGEVADIAVVPPESSPRTQVVPGDTLPPPATFEEEAHVHIGLSIQEPFIDNITTSSRAQLAILGVGAERYVKITAGDVREPPLEPGSTIPTIASVDWDLVLGRLARALNESQEIVVLSEELRGKVFTPYGTVGRLLARDDEVYIQFRTLQRETESLLDLMDHGPGFIALYRQDHALQARMDSLRANLHAIQAAIDDPQGGLHGWSERTELDAALADLRSEMTNLDARLDAGQGSLSRFFHDQELWIQVRILSQEIGELVAAFKDNPLGFINIEVF